MFVVNLCLNGLQDSPLTVIKLIDIVIKSQLKTIKLKNPLDANIATDLIHEYLVFYTSFNWREIFTFISLSTLIIPSTFLGGSRPKSVNFKGKVPFTQIFPSNSQSNLVS